MLLYRCQYDLQCKCFDMISSDSIKIPQTNICFQIYEGLENVAIYETKEDCNLNHDVCFTKITLEESNVTLIKESIHLLRIHVRKGCGIKADLESELKTIKDQEENAVPLK